MNDFERKWKFLREKIKNDWLMIEIRVLWSQGSGVNVIRRET